jgi:hypothetical protein
MHGKIIVAMVDDTCSNMTYPKDNKGEKKVLRERLTECDTETEK